MPTHTHHRRDPLRATSEPRAPRDRAGGRALGALALLVTLACLAPPAEVDGGTSAPLVDPPEVELIQRLRSERPRMGLDRERVQRLLELAKANPQIRRFLGKLQSSANQLVRQGSQGYSLPGGARGSAHINADTLRRAGIPQRLGRAVQVLGVAYAATGERRFLDRLWHDLEQVSRLPHWNPDSFLDTAAVMSAVARAYDQHYHDWSPQQREIMRGALVEKGLRPAAAYYRGEGAGYPPWAQETGNWNQICNAAVIRTLVAIGDEIDRHHAAQIASMAVASNRLALAGYGPDGGWFEGPGYWAYGTGHQVELLEALEEAAGTDFGLAEAEGFADTGYFPIYLAGPTRRLFQFGDYPTDRLKGDDIGLLYWLGRRFDRPEYIEFAEKHGALSTEHILRTGGRLRAAPLDLPTDRLFRGVGVATARGAWNDPRTPFVGLKAGWRRHSHAHLDRGTFVLDALGQRWATDLGSDEYLRGYFDMRGGRWTFYRNRAEGHNTLVIDPGRGPDQRVDGGSGEILCHDSSPDRWTAVADLAPGYPAATRAVRGLGLIDRRWALLQDEVELRRPADLWWFVHTEASVAIAHDGRRATLTAGGERMEVELLSPAGARLGAMPAHPLPTSPDPSGQSRNPGVSKLFLHLEGVREAQIAVAFVPVSPATANVRPAPVPLAEWCPEAGRPSASGR